LSGKQEGIDKDLILEAEEGANKIELDVKKELDKVSVIINNLKETALNMKGAEVKMKNWSLLVSYTEEGEYTIDFKMQLSVKPEKME
jgi:hypothetical protein